MTTAKTHNPVRIQREHAPFALVELSAHAVPEKGDTAIRLMYAEALLGGCGAYSKDTFIDALMTLGSEIRVRPSYKTIDFSLTARTENLTKTLALFTQMLEKPLFTPKEIVRIKKYLTNSLTLAKEDARPRARDAFVNTVVPKDDARFVEDIDSTIQALAQVTRAQLLAFHTQVRNASWNYTSGGNARACATIEKTLARITHTPREMTVPNTTPSPTSIKQTIVKLINIPHKQNIEFSIGASVPLLLTDAEYPALFFGVAVLGIYGGFSGRLMSTVREKEGLTYTIYNQIESITASETGFWRIMTFFSPKDTVKGITSTLREIQTIHKKGITQDELVRFKAILKTRFAMVEDSLIKKVREAHGYTEAGLTLEAFESFKSEIENMTRARVNTALKKYLHPKKLVISGAGPIRSIEKEIEKFAKAK